MLQMPPLVARLYQHQADLFGEYQANLFCHPDDLLKTLRMSTGD